MSAEEWRPIPGFPGYFISDRGRFVSHMRKTPIVMRTTMSAGYPGVILRRDGKRKMMRAHVAVALAFLGPRPPGQDVRHLDGDHTNPHVSNLAYGTRTENMADAIRHGRRLGAAQKDRCLQGHPYSGGNLYVDPGGVQQHCRACRRAATRAYRERRNAARLAS